MFGFKKKDGKDDKDNKDNKENNLNPFAKTDTKDDGNQQQQQQQQQAPATDNKVNIQEFYQQQGLYKDVDPAAMMKAMQDGNTEAFEGHVAKIMENAVSVALNASGAVMDKRMASFKESAVADSLTANDVKMAIAQMNRELPFTGMDEVAPMAKQVLEGYMGQKGMTVDKAISNVKDYFKAVSGEAAQALNLELTDKSDTRDGMRGSRVDANLNNNNNDDNANDDWIDVLSGGNQSFDDKQQQQTNDSSK